MRSWFLKRDGKVSGPFPESKLRASMKSGKIHAEDSFCLEKNGSYISRSELIKMCLSPPTTSDSNAGAAKAVGPPPLPSCAETEGHGGLFGGDSAFVPAEQAELPIRQFPSVQAATHVLQQPALNDSQQLHQVDSAGGFLSNAAHELTEKEDRENREAVDQKKFAIVAVCVAALLIPVLVFFAVQASSHLGELFSGGEASVASSNSSSAKALKSKLRRKLMSSEKKSTLQRELQALQTELVTSELSAKSAFHQQAARSRAAMRAVAVLAQIVGVSSSETEGVVRTAELNEISAETALQQVAIYLKAQVDLLRLAAEEQGASKSDTATVNGQLATAEISASNINQQNAARLEAAVSMAKLFVESAGGKVADTSQVVSSMVTQEIGASTVYQQIAVRQDAYMKMMEVAGPAFAVDSSKLGSVRSDAALDDVRASTVQQQIVARMSGTKDMILLLCESQL